MQATKYTYDGLHHGFESKGRPHQKSKRGVAVACQKGLMSSNFFKKKFFLRGRELTLSSSSSRSMGFPLSIAMRMMKGRPSPRLMSNTFDPIALETAISP